MVNMISWLKKHFIPHEGNEHRPHILRKENVFYISIAVICVEIIFFLIPTLTFTNRINIDNMAEVIAAVLGDLTNAERSANNLPILTVSPILNKAAVMKAEDMARKGYFAHTSPEGKTPWYWLQQAGYHYQYAGENLAINFTDSKDVTDAWMNSPTHRANIEKGNYTEVGTGIAKGMYEGREAVFVAQVYANPAPVSNIVEQNIITPVNKTKTPVNTNGVKISKIVEKESVNILGAAISTSLQNVPEKIIEKPSLWQKIYSSPRNSVNVILYIVFGIITFALLLYIFIKMKNHHKDLITNGLMALAVIGAIFVMNNYLSHKNMVITDSLDYSNQL